MKSGSSLFKQYMDVRQKSQEICFPLQKEDYVVQPNRDVSPPKWHLGHTSWFFETFVLKEYLFGYQIFNDQYDFVFNSYYETVGARVIRTNRGNLSRPSVDDVFAYRKYVDEHMVRLLGHELSPNVHEIIVLGINHEQQHQELLLTDIKYILGHNPLFPSYERGYKEPLINSTTDKLWPNIAAGLYNIGFDGDGFSFDNEHGRHQVWLDNFRISSSLVSNQQYQEFIEAGGYKNFVYWHAEGWDWVKRESVVSPLYWHQVNGHWMEYDLGGLSEINPDAPVTHISYYEAAAFASWVGKRLPTEAEWEVASPGFTWGQRWEWTNSAYLPYPGFKRAAGALGEYNGKFMINQMVLRGASIATPKGHERPSYRNFFHPDLRWQYTGIRLVEDN